MREKILTAFLCLVVLAGGAGAADISFPYADLYLSLPPADDPIPGLGTYYSTLACGMKSALWNPASLGRLKLSESSVAVSNDPGRLHNLRNYKIAEQSGTFETSSDGGAGGAYGLFLRYPSQIGGGINTKEVDVQADIDHTTATSGVDYSAALKINDWLTIGFDTMSPLSGALNTAGEMPTTGRAITSMYNADFGQMKIDADGILNFTYEQGGTVITYESAAPVWSGFLSQEVTLPVISLAELRNNVNIQAPYVGTVAANFNKFSFGFNVIPVAATANIENSVRTVVSADTSDQAVYSPSFDPTDQADIFDWVNNPDRYGSSAGYDTKTIDLPNGEMVATSHYQGYYAASTARLDLGMQYEVNDWVTLGLAYENIGGASLDFRGNGLASYLSYREFNTAEVSNLFDPGTSGSWSPFTDRWITTFEVGDSNLALEQEKSYPLPKRLRYGIAIKRPFLIAIDFENNQVPITFNTNENGVDKVINVSGINYVRLGVETKVFTLPWRVRSGLTLMSKPTITGLTAEAQENVDRAFRFGYLPVDFNLGTDFNSWGTIWGGSLGVNPGSLISLAQIDITNVDLTKTVFYNLYIQRDAWLVNYLFQVDPLATAAAYSARTVPAGEEKKFEVADLKFVQTLGVTYRF